jgi:hypothetical protein
LQFFIWVSLLRLTTFGLDFVWLGQFISCFEIEKTPLAEIICLMVLA